MSQKPDYSVLGNCLAADRLALEPSDLHGILMARLCAGQVPTIQHWLFLAGAEDFDATALSEQTSQSLQDLLQWSVDGLQDEEMRFRLFVPDDDEPIDERVRAFSGWCSGFLAGLGEVPAEVLNNLPEDAAEFLKDLAEFARADNDQGPDSEEDERALFELGEYVRLGTILLYEVLRGPEASESVH